jgi:hypothetical protein
LRTHPATAERIERLLELAPPPAMPPFPSAHFVPDDRITTSATLAHRRPLALISTRRMT